jgi:hypothetical protein
MKRQRNREVQLELLVHSRKKARNIDTSEIKRCQFSFFVYYTSNPYTFAGLIFVATPVIAQGVTHVSEREQK